MALLFAYCIEGKNNKGILFLQSDNKDWFNWVRLVYGGFAAAFSEINNRYSSNQCFADVWTAGNGALPVLSLIDEAQIDLEKEFSRYFLGAVQLGLYTYHAVSSCQVDTALGISRSGQVKGMSLSAEALLPLFTSLTNLFGSIMSFIDGEYYLFGWNTVSFLFSFTF